MGFSWLIFFVVVIAICILIENYADPVIPRAKDTKRRRWPVNLGLYAINAGLSFALPFSALVAAQYAATHHFGLLHLAESPYWLHAAATFLIGSLASYVFHRLNHNVPVLWRLHRVHHSDNDLDWSSALRNHPGEVLLSILFRCANVLLFGLDTAAIFALYLSNTVIDLFNHTRFALPAPVERALQWVIVTPQLHHIHHSSWQPETDSNYGGDFSIWDRLFGTLNAKPLRSAESFSYGIDTVDPADVEDLDWLLTSPLVPDTTDWAESPEHARTYRP